MKRDLFIQYICSACLVGWLGAGVNGTGGGVRCTKSTDWPVINFIEVQLRSSGDFLHRDFKKRTCQGGRNFFSGFPYLPFLGNNNTLLPSCYLYQMVIHKQVYTYVEWLLYLFKAFRDQSQNIFFSRQKRPISSMRAQHVLIYHL